MNRKRAKKSPKGQIGRSSAPAREPVPAPLYASPVTGAVRAVDEPYAERGGVVLIKGAACLLGAALAIALYLAWQSAAGKAVPGCGPGSGCGQILNSRWSLATTVPVSLLGAAAYAFLLFSSLSGGPLSPARRWRERAVSVLVVAGALWFTIVQAVILEAFCPWCCAAHLLASAGVVMLWHARRRILEPPAARPGWAEFAIPLAAVAGLAVLQSRSQEPERFEEKTLAQSLVAGPGTLSLYDGRFLLDFTSLPSIGPPGGAVTGVALTDFTCPHCRELHETLTQLAAQRPGQFSTVLLPASFEPEGRELHRIMLSLWRIDPGGYGKLAEDLAGGGINPRVPDVLTAVQKQLQGRFYELAWAQSEWVQATMRKGDELLALNSREAGVATLPQLMIRDRVLTGAPHPGTLAALLDGTAAAPAVLASLPQAPAPPAAHPPPSGPGAPAAILFDSMTVDLGTVTSGESATKKVYFTNTGGEALVISDVKSSCGCATIQGAQQTVAPGKQGSFELRLDSRRSVGELAKTVDVESNAANGTVRLTVRARIWSAVILNPPTISFGTVLKGDKVAPRQVEITVTEPEPLKLGAVSCDNPYFQAEMRTIVEGRKYQLTVSVPETGDQMQSAELVLQLGHPRMKELRQRIFVQPVDPLLIQPAEVFLTSAVLQASPVVSISVICYDPSLTALEVSDVAFTGASGVAATYEPQVIKTWGRIQVTFPAGFDPGTLKDAEVTFRTNHPRYPQVRVPVRHLTALPVVNPPAGAAR